MDLQINNMTYRSLAGLRDQKPGEIPQPGKDPETIPTREPEPGVWPRKEQEIRREKEPLTIPPVAPPEVPEPPQR